MTLMRGYDGRTLAILLGNINKGLGEYRIIGMLVVYCLKDVHFLSAPFGLPEIIGIVTTIVLHVWKRQMLLSIGGGTAVYMVLVQTVFA